MAGRACTWGPCCPTTVPGWHWRRPTASAGRSCWRAPSPAPGRPPTPRSSCAQPSARATAYTEVELRPQLASGDELLEAVSPLERWELLAGACCLVAPLHPEVAYSLEVVEAMAYGTPVVTTVGTVGAELVSHGVSGLVISDAVLLPGAIGKAERLDPRRVRAHAASRFDVRGMVSAYEWLLTQLAATSGPDGEGGDAATGPDASAPRAAPAPIAWTG